MKYLPIICLVFVGLLVGLVVYQNYGASWDEPDLYKYADQSAQAYSLNARFEDRLNVESLLGPDNLRLYGPAYLLLARGFVGLFRTISTDSAIIDVWHLANYLVFLFGIVVFFKLILRWLKPVPAFVTTLLFASQPVLFGISWIDPKDIPFMVFFTAAVYFGLLFADSSRNLFDNNENKFPVVGFYGLIPTQKTLRLLKGITVFTLVVSTGLLLFSSQIHTWLNASILGLYSLPKDNLFRKVFLLSATNINTIPLAQYANKATTILNSTINGIIFGSILLGLLTTFFTFWRNWLNRLYCMLYENSSTFLKGIKVDKKFLLYFLLAAIFLGLATATRVLGPFAGALIAFIIFSNLRWKSFPLLFFYMSFSLMVVYLSWPYLWTNTLQRFFEVFIHMADNPAGVGVLFRGENLNSHNLPWDYLPHLLAITITIPAIILFVLGLFARIKLLLDRHSNKSDLVMAVWLFVPLLYVFIFHPSMYDNYRHFIFIIPPLFYFAGIALQFFFEKFSWLLQICLVLVVLLPGIFGIVKIHPYEYSYYNQLVGGLSGAAGNYEVDYWLTCYKDLTEQVNVREKTTRDIFVSFLPGLVNYYADERFHLYKANDPSYPEGSLLFLPIRRGYTSLFPEYPVEYSVVVAGIELCNARRAK